MMTVDGLAQKYGDAIKRLRKQREPVTVRSVLDEAGGGSFRDAAPVVRAWNKQRETALILNAAHDQIVDALAECRKILKHGVRHCKQPEHKRSLTVIQQDFVKLRRALAPIESLYSTKPPATQR